MKDLRPLLSDDATDVERALLVASFGEEPSTAARDRAALAAVAAGTGAAAGAHAVTWAKILASSWSKWMLLAVVVGAATWRAQRPSVAATSAIDGARLAVERAFAMSMDTRDEASQAPVVSEAPSATEARSADVESPPRRRAEPQRSLAPSIAAELALLDKARALLGAGEAAAAVRALDTYDRTFARGSLAPEARLLRARAVRALAAPERTP